MRGEECNELRPPASAGSANRLHLELWNCRSHVFAIACADDCNISERGLAILDQSHIFGIGYVGVETYNLHFALKLRIVVRRNFDITVNQSVTSQLFKYGGGMVTDGGC